MSAPSVRAKEWDRIIPESVTNPLQLPRIVSSPHTSQAGRPASKTVFSDLKACLKADNVELIYLYLFFLLWSSVWGASSWSFFFILCSLVIIVLVYLLFSFFIVCKIQANVVLKASKRFDMFFFYIYFISHLILNGCPGNNSSSLWLSTDWTPHMLHVVSLPNR